LTSTLEGVLKVFWTVFGYLNYPEAPTVEWAFETFLKWIGVASVTQNNPFKTASHSVD